MALFKSKKREVLDLTKRYHQQQERLKNIQEDMKTEPKQNSSETPGAFSFFDMANANSEQSSSSQAPQESTEDYVNVDEVQDRRKKLAKRLMDITNKLEDISNQLYHLQQRIELVEKKVSIGNY